jgi:hypothetical protein
MALRRAPTVAACVLAVALSVAVPGCGDDEPGVDEPAREGLALELGGVEYNVFITRQLNPKIPPDDAYYEGPGAPPGETLYGVFIQVCNHSDEAHDTASTFKVTDNQGNEFEPEELPEGNPFAYAPRRLEPEECIPQIGSVAALGPGAGSMLLFQLPLETTENRPLELEIKGDGSESLEYELDI